MKRALITGVTGQDGGYLAELLQEKGYQIFGLVRRTSGGLPRPLEDRLAAGGITLLPGNVRDLGSVRLAMEAARPDEVYNLAAQSHVGVSFACPDETWETNYHGVGRVVHEAMRVNPAVRIYQASTSEMFGSTPPPQNETSAFNPVSPYAEAKLRAHLDFIQQYRERDGLFACSGILFNHESPRRGKDFVTRKVTYTLAKIKLGLQDRLELGNLDARRDWGYAKEYVEAMQLMMTQDRPDDYVIATGENHTIRELVSVAADELGLALSWEGEGVDEAGVDAAGRRLVAINPAFYRPREVNDLRGDASKARAVLGWQPKTSFEDLIRMMARADYDALAHVPISVR